MKILRTQIDNRNLKTLEVYLSGCKPPHCAGCHNPEAWDFSLGEDYTKVLDNLHEKCEKYSIDTVWVLGGEPCDQNMKHLADMLESFQARGLTVVLFTRYTHISATVVQHCDYIKFGAYQSHNDSYIEPVLGLNLGSSNQKVVKIDKERFIGLPTNYLINLKLF